MFDIILLGLNHKTAPVELRERLAFSKAETVTALEAFQKDPAIIEVVLFSTCNRVEILLATDRPSEAWSPLKLLSQNLKTFRFLVLKMLFTSMKAMKRYVIFSGWHQVWIR